MKRGFTLAEVLITLGIVGVVSALTIPTLITNYQKYITVQQLRVAYKMFSEVLEQAKADNDGVLLLTEETRNENLYGSNGGFSKAYIQPYIRKTDKVKKGYNISNAAKNRSFLANNSVPVCTTKGFCYWISINQSNGVPTSTMVHSVSIIIDLNGPKGPNRAGRDVFLFYYDVKNSKTIEKFKSYLDTSRETLKGYCNSNSDSSWNGANCAFLIIKDDWKISPDYPW